MAKIHNHGVMNGYRKTMGSSLKDVERIREAWHKSPIAIDSVPKLKRGGWNKGLKGVVKESIHCRFLHRALSNGNQHARKYPVGSEPYRTKAQWHKPPTICPPL